MSLFGAFSRKKILSMKKIEPIRTAIIGAGRAGSQLARRLAKQRWPIGQVLSRDRAKSSALAAEIGAAGVSDFAQIDPETELFLIAVSDSAIAEAAQRLSKIQPKALAAHVSGATPRSVLDPFFKKNGVVWPIQTFSSERRPDWRRVPVVVESSDEATASSLKQLARRLSSNVLETDGAQRAKLHLAATMANNFSNRLFALAQFYLEKNGLPFDALRPLILETAQKAQTVEPSAAQTGPARRGDRTTIERHLSLLEKEPELRDLYLFFTKSIERDRDQKGSD